jgi:MFS family permease
MAGRIFDRLITHYGEASVFMDIDNIPYGIDFRKHIHTTLQECDIVLAVVGPRWLGTDTRGSTRINNVSDPVRVEIEAALAGDIPLIPVLVEDAAMPDASELPESLREFAFRNAASVDVGRDFRAHMDRLIRSMDRILEAKDPPSVVVPAQLAPDLAMTDPRSGQELSPRDTGLRFSNPPIETTELNAPPLPVDSARSSRQDNTNSARPRNSGNAANPPSEPIVSRLSTGGNARDSAFNDETLASDPPSLAAVIFAASIGSMLTWYDFYLYGSLAGIIGAQFFSAYPPATRDIFALLAFAAGFLVRPFGAIVFGRIGDIVGRKYTFLVTITIMGLSTFIVGLLPNAATIGIIAPIILIGLRLAQGLALGGEYHGAVTYVAEHSPQGKRGYYTSFIQTTATLGLFLALLTILFTRAALGEADFAAWGWRIPFLMSIALLAISVWIRLRLNESPVFQKMKDEGKSSKAPLTEAFANWSNAKIVILALIGGTMGQGVVWYAGQFYALFFMQSILKVDGYTANLLIAWSLLLGTGFFIVFGWLSDKIGRKPIILAGCLIAALTFFPIFRMISTNANPSLEKAIESTNVEVVADPLGCSNLFNPIGIRVFTAPCDTARAYLMQSSVKYSNVPGITGPGVKITVNGKEIPYITAAVSNPLVLAAVQAAGYPKPGDAGIVKMAHPLDIFKPQVAAVIGLLFILMIFVTMVYGPIAAMLVELFPTRIRCTSMSLPYHIGNGWFGGLLPATAFAIVASTGDIYAGLWYPIIFASITAVVGFFFLPETKDVDIKTN